MRSSFILDFFWLKIECAWKWFSGRRLQWSRDWHSNNVTLSGNGCRCADAATPTHFQASSATTNDDSFIAIGSTFNGTCHIAFIHLNNSLFTVTLVFSLFCCSTLWKCLDSRLQLVRSFLDGRMRESGTVAFDWIAFGVLLFDVNRKLKHKFHSVKWSIS